MSTSKEYVARVMKQAHRSDFASQAREELTRKQGLTEKNLAKAMRCENNDTFRRNLGLAIDSQAIHKRNGHYYPGAWTAGN
jgi:hypothetical protein